MPEKKCRERIITQLAVHVCPFARSVRHGSSRGARRARCGGGLRRPGRVRGRGRQGRADDANGKSRRKERTSCVINGRMPRDYLSYVESVKCAAVRPTRSTAMASLNAVAKRDKSPAYVPPAAAVTEPARDLIGVAGSRLPDWEGG